MRYLRSKSSGLLWSIFFFFQAEDGIRDIGVTGVQTCALPILTDVLVLRGDDDVVQNTVNDPGAEFTERGYGRLGARAEGDDNLATCIGLRPSIPRHHYLTLIAKASATVRARLEAAHPPLAGDVTAAVREATRRARSAPSAVTRETAIAHALVKSLYEDGRLDEDQVAAFARAGTDDDTKAARAA